MDLKFLQKIVKPADTKIVLLVMDGLGGLANGVRNFTELEAAFTPNLDELARSGVCGLHQPVDTGITPGSGTAHLSLFGYDPIKYQVGRGVLSALGINFNLKKNDIAARGNFCTVDEKERIIDRRAGRISTAQNKKLCKLLKQIELPDVQIFVETIKEHRFLLVLRGANLHSGISDTDPQMDGTKPLNAEPVVQKAEKAAGIINQFIGKAKEKLANADPAFMILLRGFSQLPEWPEISHIFQLKAAAIASYPMYKGVARLAGMDILKTGDDLEDKFAVLEKNWQNYDFFFLHVKSTDSAGEDGDFERKIELIENVDRQIPRLMSLFPDVVIVTGDHSTPALFGLHSWHPVPVILWSKSCLPDKVEHFGERDCIAGGLGPRFPGRDLIPLALANALRLEKFNA